MYLCVTCNSEDSSQCLLLPKIKKPHIFEQEAPFKTNGKKLDNTNKMNFLLDE